MALLEEQAFEKITVRELCDRAMVHRTTFYKHYADKYALLEQGMRQMYDVLVAGEQLYDFSQSLNGRVPHTFTQKKLFTFMVGPGDLYDDAQHLKLCIASVN